MPPLQSPWHLSTRRSVSSQEYHVYCYWHYKYRAYVFGCFIKLSFQRQFATARREVTHLAEYGDGLPMLPEAFDEPSIPSILDNFVVQNYFFFFFLFEKSLNAVRRRASAETCHACNRCSKNYSSASHPDNTSCSCWYCPKSLINLSGVNNST